MSNEIAQGLHKACEYLNKDKSLHGENWNLDAGKLEAALTEAGLNLGIHQTEKQNPLQLCIHLDGGLVQDVIVKELPETPLDIRVLDYDTSGVDEEDTTLITQSDGSKAEAYVCAASISDTPAIDLNDIFKS